MGIVRDTTRGRHAIIQRKIINHDSGTGRHILCSWSDCELDGFELYKVRVKTGNADDPRYMNYVFCTERHKQYWLNDVRPGGGNNLPPGYKRSILGGRATSPRAPALSSNPARGCSLRVGALFNSGGKTTWNTLGLESTFG
jgi:hypothetical protein